VLKGLDVREAAAALAGTAKRVYGFAAGTR